MDKKVTSLGIPFGKFVDPNIEFKLDIIKENDISDMEYEVLYLFKDRETGTYYSCLAFDGGGGGPYVYTDEIMLEFISEYGDKFEHIWPKHEDSIVDYYLMRVIQTEKL